LTMIHPSTLAGPNWFTGSFGTNNPFQQNTSPFFRNTPFQGQQGGFGFGNNPFQNPSLGFGNNPAQFQNTINEIIRQTVPTPFTNLGFQPTNGFQTPTFGWNTNGFQTQPFGWNTSAFQTPTNTWSFGNQFQNTPFNNWQTQSYFTELIRQTTNQVLQSFQQLSQTSPSNPQQQLWNTCVQICQQACYASCQPVCQAIVTCAVEAVNQQNPNNQSNIQNIWNTCVQICQQACQQVCQTVCQCVITTLVTTTNQQNQTLNFTQQNTPYGFTQQNNPFSFTQPNTPFNFATQNTPFNINTSAPQYSFTPGIPTGVGAF
jgi:hypothetical protein